MSFFDNESCRNKVEPYYKMKHLGHMFNLLRPNDANMRQ